MVNEFQAFFRNKNNEEKERKRFPFFMSFFSSFPYELFAIINLKLVSICCVLKCRLKRIFSIEEHNKKYKNYCANYKLESLKVFKKDFKLKVVYILILTIIECTGIKGA